ncbi:hypothetical protein FRC08_009038 [Ceratobasidium sp. 394]|nr:hypothetical protein FRC08_009038 [Ceratobasidium sp. 394]
MSRNTPTNQDLGGNNKAQPPVVLFQHLSDSEKENLLDKNGYMYGICIDGNDSPRRSTQVVARCRTQGQHHSPTWIEEQDAIISENISAQTSRDSNYIHQGWSIAAAATIPQ